MNTIELLWSLVVLKYVEIDVIISSAGIENEKSKIGPKAVPIAPMGSVAPIACIDATSSPYY